MTSASPGKKNQLIFFSLFSCYAAVCVGPWGEPFIPLLLSRGLLKLVSFNLTVVKQGLTCPRSLQGGDVGIPDPWPVYLQGLDASGTPCGRLTPWGTGVHSLPSHSAKVRQGWSWVALAECPPPPAARCPLLRGGSRCVCRAAGAASWCLTSQGFHSPLCRGPDPCPCVPDTSRGKAEPVTGW